MKTSLQYHDPKKTAEILGTSTQRLANLRFAGTGPAYSRIGTAIRYRLSDIEAYMDSKKVTPEQGVN